MYRKLTKSSMLQSNDEELINDADNDSSQQEKYSSPRDAHDSIGDKSFDTVSDQSVNTTNTSIEDPYLCLMWHIGIKAKGSSWKIKSVALFGQDLLVLGGAKGRMDTQLYVCDTDTLQWSSILMNGQCPEESPFYCSVTNENEDKLFVFRPVKEIGCLAKVMVSYASNDPSRLTIKKGQSLIIDLNDIKEEENWIKAMNLGGQAGLVPLSCIRFEGNKNTHTGLGLSVLNFRKNIQWSTIACSGDVAPKAREFFACSRIDNKIFLFGGRDESGYSYNDMFVLDVDRLCWELCYVAGDKPRERYAHTATIIDDNKLLIYGGLDSVGKYLNDMYIFNIDSNTWSRVKAKGRKPRSRAFHTLARFNDYLILYGGRNAARVFGDVYAFHIQTQTWIKAKITGEAPGERFLHFVGVSMDSLVFFGGRDKKTHLFDLFYLKITREEESLPHEDFENVNIYENYELAVEADVSQHQQVISDYKKEKPDCDKQVSLGVYQYEKELKRVSIMNNSPSMQSNSPNIKSNALGKKTRTINIDNHIKSITERTTMNKNSGNSKIVFERGKPKAPILKMNSPLITESMTEIKRKSPVKRVMNSNLANFVPNMDTAKYESILRDPQKLKKELQRIFTFYCLYGNRMNLDYLSAAKFKLFIKDVKLLYYGIKQEDIDLIYLKVVKSRNLSTKKKESFSQQKAPNNSNQRMDLHSFFEALKMLAQKIHPNLTPATGLIHLLVSNILPFANKASDEFSELDMNEEQTRKIFDQNRANLQRIFSVYSNIDSHATKGHPGTHMSCNELLYFISDFGLIPKLVTKKDIFRIVRSSTSAECPDEVSYTEFEECFAKCSIIAYSKHPYNKKHPTIPDKIQGILDRMDIKDFALIRKMLEKLGRNSPRFMS